MGASFDYLTYKDMDRKEMEEDFSRRCDRDEYENGASYSGSIGMLSKIGEFVDRRYNDKNSAIDHITEHHSKWECAMAVSFLENNEKMWVVGGWCAS